MFAKIEEVEIKELATRKASGLATQLYLVLSSHCWGGNKCFPSLERIKEMLGNAYHIGSIHRALKWLEDQGLIKRQEAKSRHRFTLKIKRITKLLNPIQKHDHKRKKKTKNTRYSKYKRNNQSKSVNLEQPKQQTERDKTIAWLDKAMTYVNDLGPAPIEKISKKSLNLVLGSHCATMFWDDIQPRLGHLMV